MRRYCSFCGKERGEVFYLMEGPAAHICDECVILAVDIVQRARGRAARGEPVDQPRTRTMRDFLDIIKPKEP